MFKRTSADFLMIAIDGFERVLFDVEKFNVHFKTLTPSQKEFVVFLNAWFLQKRHTLVIVSGGPGSGKTYGIINTIDHLKVPILKMAPTARIAKNINGRTIHSSLKLAWGEGTVLHNLQEKFKYETNIEVCFEESKVLLSEFKYTEPAHIVILEEVGMIPFWLSYQILRYFHRKIKPVLIIYIGDERQLKPVMSEYNVFQVTFPQVEIVPFQMTESIRFTPSYDTVINRLRAIMDSQDDVFQYVRDTFPIVNITMRLLVKADRVLVHQNSTVEFYNLVYLSRFPGTSIRLYRINEGVLDKTCYVDLKPQCPVLLTANHCSSRTNGTPLIYLRYDRKHDVAVCFDTLTETLVRVLRNPFTGMIPLVINFAGTIHKFQGETINEPKILFNFNQCTDIHLVYTALSRVRSMHQILGVEM